MTKSIVPLFLILVASAAAQQAAPAASDVRYVDINGVRYQEVRTRVNQPVRDVRYVDQQQVTYQNQYRTAVQSVPNNTFVPQTSYQCVPRLYDWWRVLGVFGEPYVAYAVEPQTRWQVQTRYVPVPVTQQVTVPYTRTARVAVPYLRFEEREQVTRVAVGPAPAAAGQYAGNTISPPATNLAAPQMLTPNPPVAGPSPGSTPSSSGPTYVPVNRSIAATDPYSTHAFESSLGATSRTWTDNRVAQGMTFPLQGGTPLAAQGVAPQVTVTPIANNGGPYGGVARLDGDPPRFGTSRNDGGAYSVRQ